MNYKIEALYMTLSGYAKEIIEMNDNSLEGSLTSIARNMNREFRKKTNLYSNEQAKKIVETLQEWDKEFADNSTAPSILLILTLDYLLNVKEHHRTKLLFGHYRYDVNRLFNVIEQSEYKEHLYKHMDIIDKFVGESK